jgi:regulatory protein YycH of two-component signal transduction system YycFG
MNMTWTHIKHALLAILIVLSFLLTIGIWSAGGHLGEPESTNNNSTPSPLVERTKSEVFSPYEVALHGTGEQGQVQLTTSKETQDIIDEILDEVLFQEVVSIEHRSFNEYQDYLSWGNWIEFVYPGHLPLGLLENNFENLDNNYAEQTYDRFAINLNDLEQAEFYNTQEERVYRVNVSEISSELVNIFLDTEAISYVAAESIEIGNGYVYLPIENIMIEQKNYTVDRLPIRFYTNQFFADPSQMDERTTGNVTRYIDMTTEVRFHQTEYTLAYESQQSAVDDLSFTERLDRSFMELQLVENWTEEVKYGSYHPATNEVTFQRYIDGLPVYSPQQNESMVRMVVNNNGLATLNLPLRVVQTPLDTGEQMVEMMSSEEIVSLIDESAHVSREDLDDIRMGLTWQESEEDSRVIEFIPEWYVRVEQTWYEIEQFIRLQEE